MKIEMVYSVGFMLCPGLGLFNLPGVLKGEASSIGGLIFCCGIALYLMIVAIILLARVI